MGLFSKTIPGSPDMPKGYDDPASPFFIPEDLRPIWADVAPATNQNWHDEVSMLAQERARQRASETMGEVPPFHPEANDDYRKDRAAAILAIDREATTILPQVLSAGYAEFTARAIHADRLARARAHLDSTTQRRESAERVLRAETCPVCGEHDVLRIGKIEERHLVDDMPAWLAGRRAPDDVVIRSCGLCRHEAAEQYAASRVDLAVPNGESRRSVVRASMGRAWSNMAGEVF